MAQKFDGLIEAVRYSPDGQLLLVRAYERRGPTYSDNVLIDRSTLVDHLKRRKRFVTGKRVHRMGVTFAVGQPVRLSGSPGQELIVTASQPGSKDFLEGVPIF